MKITTLVVTTLVVILQPSATNTTHSTLLRNISRLASRFALCLEMWIARGKAAAQAEKMAAEPVEAQNGYLPHDKTAQLSTNF